MMGTQCFKTKEGTAYAVEVANCLRLQPKWDEVYPKLSELLGENITQLAHTTKLLAIVTDELTKEENKKLFKKDGTLKTNTIAAKNLFQEYLGILEELGLAEFKELRDIHFIYGVMRRRGESLEKFRTQDYEIYFKANFDLEKSSNGAVEPITEIEYAEKYVEELKKLDAAGK